MATSSIRSQNGYSSNNKEALYDMASPLQYVLRSIPVVDFVVNAVQQNYLSKQAANYRPPAGVISESLKMNPAFNNLVQIQKIQAATSLVKTIMVVALCILFPGVGCSGFTAAFLGLYIASVWNNNKCIFENERTIKTHQNLLDRYVFLPSFLPRPIIRYSFL